MGNAHHGDKKMHDSMERVESKVGKVQLSGRYHRAPKKLEDDYEVTQKVLGSGYNGVVRMGVSKLNKNQKVAVKAFKLSGLQGDKRAQLESEVEIFLCMDHPHVTRLFDVYESNDTLHLVMECMDGGELFDRVTELKQFSERDAADSVWQMLLALNYIHSHGIVHRDLKLENFLYDQKTSHHLKLIDFGFSKVWEANVKMHVSCGTLSYVAPEVLEKSYTSQCDLWSLGVIVFILLAGYMPFSGSEAVQTKNISEGKYKWKPERWKNVSEDATNFVKALLQLDPKKRLDAQKALDHTWIANRHRYNKDAEVTQEVVDGLRNFGHASKFRRCCMEMMAWSLSNEERAKVREYFIMMDTTQQGTITLPELRDVLINKFHISNDETKAIFEALDSNHDEEIHYSDFLAAMVNTRIALHDDLLKSAFKKFDTDNSGFITLQNMREVLGEHFEGEDVEDLMKEADFTKDGKISYEEFVSYIRGTPHEKHQDASAKMIDNMIKRGDTGEYGKGVDNKNKIALRPSQKDGPLPKAKAKASPGGGGGAGDQEKTAKCGCALQ
jgi:calcium-dependent protein kinase